MRCVLVFWFTTLFAPWFKRTSPLMGAENKHRKTISGAENTALTASGKCPKNRRMRTDLVG